MVLHPTSFSAKFRRSISSVTVLLGKLAFAAILPIQLFAQNDPSALDQVLISNSAPAFAEMVRATEAVSLAGPSSPPAMGNDDAEREQTAVSAPPIVYGAGTDVGPGQRPGPGRKGSPTLSSSLMEPQGHAFKRDIPRGFEDVGHLPIFGMEVFRELSQTMLSASNGPLGSDYVVGPGDAFQIFIWGLEEASFSAEINVDGDLLLARFGRIPVAGLTFGEMKNALHQAVQRQKQDFELSVLPLKQRSNRIFLMGEVRTPGAFDCAGNVTAFGALFAAGGPTSRGTLRSIQVKRGNRLMATIDLYDFLLAGNRASDIPLQEGDVVFVPLAGTRIGITGEVRRPAIYELLPREETLGQALDFAGGITPMGDLKHVQIQRVEAHARKVVLENDLGTKSVRDQRCEKPVKDLDVITILSLSPRLSDQVFLTGHVFQPGPRPWSSGIRLSDILDQPSILKNDAHLEYGEILRESGAAGKTSVERFNPGDVLQRKPGADVVLHSRDRIRIFSMAEMAEHGFVHVSGEVQHPGSFPLITGLTIKDLIQRAGGLKIGASKTRAEFSRRVVQSGETRFVRNEIDLESVIAEDPKANLVLHANDELVVRTVPNWHKRNEVTLAGEFVYPGTYSFEPGERLSSLIARAGGLTTKGFMKGAVMKRRSLMKAQEENIRRFKEEIQAEQAITNLKKASANRAGDGAGDKGTEQLQAIFDRLSTKGGPQGRLIVRLSEKTDFAGSSDDLLLEDGDEISIPQMPSTVIVDGAVRNPTGIIWAAKLSLKDYIDQAGGFSRNADKRSVCLIKADGSTVPHGKRPWSCFLATKPEPGDTIWVPLDMSPLPPSRLARTQSIMQILSNAALTVLAIDRAR